jgi:hypothetical protein
MLILYQGINAIVNFFHITNISSVWIHTNFSLSSIIADTDNFKEGELTCLQC